MYFKCRPIGSIVLFAGAGSLFLHLQHHLVCSMAIITPYGNVPSSMPIPIANDKRKVTLGSKVSGQPSVILPAVSRDLTSWTPRAKLFSNIRATLTPESKKYVATWEKQEDFAPVANSIACSINSCFEEDKEAHSARLADIEDSMKTFMLFCEENLDAGRILGYEIKVSNLQGEKATQCPAYHVDNVPIRWIETLHGPGSVYLDPEEYTSHYGNGGLLRNMVDNTPPAKFREYPGTKWKEEVVKVLEIKPSQAKAGQPIMLVGHRWADVAKDTQDSRDGVLHRSPTNVLKSQARILLVLDVKMEGCNECDCGLVH